MFQYCESIWYNVSMSDLVTAIYIRNLASMSDLVTDLLPYKSLIWHQCREEICTQMQFLGNTFSLTVPLGGFFVHFPHDYKIKRRRELARLRLSPSTLSQHPAPALCPTSLPHHPALSPCPTTLPHHPAHHPAPSPWPTNLPRHSA